MSSVELQFEFEWLKRAINCSKWAISLQVGMRSLKTAGRRGTEEAEEGGEIQHRRFLESESDRSDPTHTSSRGKWNTRSSSHESAVYFLDNPTHSLSIEDALDHIGIGDFQNFSDWT